MVYLRWHKPQSAFNSDWCIFNSAQTDTFGIAPPTGHICVWGEKVCPTWVVCPCRRPPWPAGFPGCSSAWPETGSRSGPSALACCRYGNSRETQQQQQHVSSDVQTYKLCLSEWWKKNIFLTVSLRPRRKNCFASRFSKRSKSVAQKKTPSRERRIPI